MHRHLVTFPVISLLALFTAGCEDPYATAPGGAERRASPSPARRPSEDWQVYTSQEGRFSVRMPAGGRADDSDATVAEGRVPANSVDARSPSGTLFQVVSYHRTPITSPEKIAAFLDSSCEMHEEGYGLLSRTTVSLGSYQGREVTFKMSVGDGDKYFARRRMFGIKDRQFTVTACTPPGRVEGEEVQRFFDSFKILELDD